MSPVTILTTIPALLQLFTAYGMPSFKGSLIPAKPNMVKFFYKSSGLYPYFISYGLITL